MQTIKVGSIAITSNKMIVSDPCYDRGIWCAAEIKDFPNGSYDAFIDTGIAKDWGKRVFRMRILKTGTSLRDCCFKVLDCVPVDCATLGFFDDAYHEQLHSDKRRIEDWYQANVVDAFGVKLEDANITDERCFMATTGIGDGCYTVLELYDADDVLIGLEAQFLDDEDEED